MNKQFNAQAEIIINVPITKVWDAITDPRIIKEYMFGTEVVSEWKQNDPIIWKGIYNDKPFKDKGKIIRIEPKQLLEFSHYSPLSGQPDLPENYHTMTYELSNQGEKTFVKLTQDNNPNKEAQIHAEEMWTAMLENMKKILEK